MKNNPFSLSFGKEPVSLINRNVQSYEIIDTFEDENPTYQVCIICCKSEQLSKFVRGFS